MNASNLGLSSFAGSAACKSRKCLSGVDSWLVEGQGSVIERDTSRGKPHLHPSLVLASGRESGVLVVGRAAVAGHGPGIGRGSGAAGCVDTVAVARSVHDPGKLLIGLATAVDLGGDCAADLAVVRAQPALFGWWPPTRRCPAGHHRRLGRGEHSAGDPGRPRPDKNGGVGTSVTVGR